MNLLISFFVLNLTANPFIKWGPQVHIWTSHVSTQYYVYPGSERCYQPDSFSLKAPQYLHGTLRYPHILNPTLSIDAKVTYQASHIQIIDTYLNLQYLSLDR
ncbi:MAG: hypothetical protein VXY77_02570 [Pseudomonadota bacterium]|nr:hypothetical protein [Pseudomonadota bacterium]